MNINYILLISVLIGNIYARGYDNFTGNESEEILSILDRILKYTKNIEFINLGNLYQMLNI